MPCEVINKPDSFWYVYCVVSLLRNAMELDPLTQLSVQLSNSELKHSQLLMLICSAIRHAIPPANKVSLWRFNDDKSAIICVGQLKEGSFSEPENFILQSRDYPEYFDAMLNQQSIMASDARNHPQTQCFGKDYFAKENVYSILDYVFQNDFAPFGIICCESVGKQVEWKPSDLESLKRAARIVSIFSNIRNIV